MAEQFVYSGQGGVPHYKIFLRVTEPGGGGAQATNTIEFWCPDSISFALNGEWDAPFATTLSNLTSNGISGAVSDAVQGITGFTPRFKAASQLMWQGTTHVEFAFTFELRADNNTKKDVTDKLRSLIQYALPHEEKNTKAIIAPLSGYRIDVGSGDIFAMMASTQRPQMDMQIGQFLVIEDVVLRNVSPEIPTRFHTSGRPMESNVQVNISTRYTPTAQDARNWFIGYATEE